MSEAVSFAWRQRYAADTNVPVDRSKAEIERILARYGATEFASAWSGRTALVAFRAHDRMVKFTLPLPDPADKQYRHTPTGRVRRGAWGEDRARAAWEQDCRQRWRSLALAIKAKLEAVASGIATFEQEFLAHIMLPDGRTVASWISPQIAQAYRDGRVPKALMPGLEPR